MALPLEALPARYTVKRELGRGGMGEVHLAFDNFLQREVAIKLTDLAALDDPELGAKNRKLWMNETRLAGRLHHPHIVECYEAGSTAAFAYLVMEYVEGTSLYPHTSASRLLPIGTVVDVLFKTGDALNYASKMGMLHRDIKPANVLMSPAGDVKLTDFGACYLTNTEETQVQDVGTLPFLPPEHFASRPPTVATDVYALGVTAYQLLTGSYPFRGETVGALVNEKLNEDIVPLEVRRADVPGALRFIVHRAMQRDLSMRYATWDEFCDELAQLLHIERPESKDLSSTVFTTLRSAALFERLSDTETWELARMSRLLEKPAGAPIFGVGDASDMIYLVASGSVSIRLGEVQLNQLQVGECFGEIGYLDETQTQRTASAVAGEHCMLIEIPTASLREASSALQASILRVFSGLLIERLKQADARYVRASTG